MVRDRVLRTQERVQDSKITAETIEQSLRSRTTKEARERLASRLEVEERAEDLTSVLLQADQLLELSASSVEIVQQALSIRNSAGAAVGTDSVDRLLEEIASLRGQLAEATESVERVREHVDEASEGQSSEERIDHAIELALRVVATLSSIDLRLANFEYRLSETQGEAHLWETDTLRWILIANIGISLVIAWMAVGQISVCILVWRR